MADTSELARLLEYECLQYDICHDAITYSVRHNYAWTWLLGRVMPAAQHGPITCVELDITSWKSHRRVAELDK